MNVNQRWIVQGDSGGKVNISADVDVLLTVHLSITSANDQLDAQFLYFIIRLLQSSTCFEQRRAQHREVKLY